MFPRHKVHGHGNGGCRNPEVNVGAAVAMFVDIDADHAFAESVDACEYNSAGDAKTKFSEYHHLLFLSAA